MRINTDVDNRTELYERTADALDEKTKVGGIDAACRHVQSDLRAKERALNHPDMTEELAEILSTPYVTLRYEVETAVETE